MTSDGGSAPSDEDLRKHLDLIQAVITRMSAASSTAKGWLLPVVMFAFLDANYLRQEQGYRALYDAVARKTRPVPLFSLAIEDALDPTPAPTTRWGRARGRVQKWFPGLSVWFSWSIAPFYGLLLVVGVVVFLVAR